MSCNISSNNNRFYVALESTYGIVPPITAQNRIPAVKLAARQVLEQSSRRDKTGSRTFPGLPNSIRKRTAYQLNTFLTEWTNQSAPPSYGPLFQAGMGGSPLLFAGGTVASTNGSTGVTFAAPHGLSVGQAVTSGGEIRFVAGIQNTTTVFVNAPFTAGLTAGSGIGPTIGYPLATDLGSVSLFDYWDPSGAVQRLLDGAAVDHLRVKVNGDFQEFAFAGPARDLIDSASFMSGQGGLTQYPAEPTIANFDYTIVPGHLGEVWMGVTPAQFQTVTQAELALDNHVELRVREFGSDFAKCIAAGTRSVRLDFSLFETVDQQTAALYQAARQRSPIGVMLQLGEQSGQLFGAYMPAMVPEVPEFDDRETRLQWRFRNSRAQGTSNDELYIAFG
ncbi:MAG TPA: hypothetical protein VGR73_01885 [Bryobacteraceae bacterium]|nr:hypothetical protein [Bryobacteraceae bacterium]